MFTEAYRDMFATLGIQLRPEDGCASADVENGERRLEITIPQSLREYYVLAGREKRINQFQEEITRFEARIRPAAPNVS